MKIFSILTGLALLGAACGSTLGSAESAVAPATLPQEMVKIDINTAEIPALESIPEIGTSFANAVVAARPFKSVYELAPLLKISPEAMVALHAKVTASAPKIASPLAIKPSPATAAPLAEHRDKPVRSSPPVDARPAASTEAGGSLGEPAKAASSASLPSAKLSDKERLEAKRRHIRPDNHLPMAVPPPPLREETKLLPPASNYVWKPGHWAPVKGEWEWTPGEWALPPTPISVWIESKYDPKDKHWTSGYWEPDTIRPAETEAPITPERK